MPFRVCPPSSPRALGHLLPLLLSVAACGGGSDSAGTPPTPPPPPTAATVTVTAASSAPLLPGGTVQLSAKAFTAAGVELTTAAISWSSASAAIATVSTSGLVTAVAAGSTTITATAGTASGTATVQVNPGGIVGSSGGTVTAANGNVTLQLPAGAVSATTPITVTPKPDTVRTEHTIGPAYLFGPSGTTFAQPVIMALKYDTAQLPPNTDLAALRVARLTNGTWVPLTDSVRVDSATNTVRAATRSFSGYVVVRNACLPLNGNTINLTGQISREDCLSAVTGRRSDYYALRTSVGEVVTLTGSGPLDGMFGVKEATVDVNAGTVWNSSSTIVRELRLLSNGDPLQLFVSGRDSATFGAYTIRRSSGVVATTTHECVTSTNGKSYIYLMPGTAMSGTVQAANSCVVNIQFGNPAAIGKPLLTHYYPVRLQAGMRYTITGVSFAPQSSLTVFLNGAVVAQDLSTTANRTVTITPSATQTYLIEVGSGGFQNANFTGNWIQPAFTYTLVVGRGVSP